MEDIKIEMKKDLDNMNDAKNTNESGNIDCLKKENLLENIKSIDVSKILFSFMSEKIKLKAIKYNKNFQNKMDIKLNNYKFYAGKYIIYLLLKCL